MKQKSYGVDLILLIAASFGPKAPVVNNSPQSKELKLEVLF